MPTIKELEHSAPNVLVEDIIVWKKALYLHRGRRRECIVELRLAKRTRVNIHSGRSLSERKCRASSAHVLSATCLETEKKLNKNKIIFSKHDRTFKYTVGKKIKPKEGFDTSIVVCSSGIHFFFRKTDARKYR